MPTRTQGTALRFIFPSLGAREVGANRQIAMDVSKYGRREIRSAGD